KKTSQAGQLVAQRARWINTWFRYFPQGFGMISKGIIRADPNRLLFGIVLLRPPLFIFLILSFICGVANIFVNPVATVVWVCGFFLFSFGFMLALWLSETDKLIYRSLQHIPQFVYYQIKALLKVKSANKYSVATRHVAEEKEKE